MTISLRAAYLILSENQARLQEAISSTSGLSVTIGDVNGI